MVYYAVIDTNVFISALLSKRADAATVRVLDAMFEGRIVPLYHEDILAEYDEVLHRSKFHFKEETIQLLINAVKQYGVEVFPQPTGEILIDMDDLIFYEVAMEKREIFLIFLKKNLQELAPDYHWSTQASGIEIPDYVWDKIEEKWKV